MKGYTYAVGDLHGRLDLLEEVIATCEAEGGEDGGKLIILGDFIDRGPDSAGIIKRLRAGPTLPNWEWVVLQGNHEAMMIETCIGNNERLLRWWVGNGGGQTLKSYGFKPGDIFKPTQQMWDDIRWLNDLPVYVEDAQRIYVHAGVPLDKQLHETSQETLQWMLYKDGGEVFADATYADDEGEMHVSGKHIVHGHHQHENHPLLKKNRTNLDSFAWKTGHLVIGIFGEKTKEPIAIMHVNGEPM